MHAWGKGHTGTLSPDGGVVASMKCFYVCTHGRACVCMYVLVCVLACERHGRGMGRHREVEGEVRGGGAGCNVKMRARKTLSAQMANPNQCGRERGKELIGGIVFPWE